MTTYTTARLTCPDHLPREADNCQRCGDGSGYVDVPTTTTCPDCNGGCAIARYPTVGSGLTDPCSTCAGSGTVPTRWATVTVGDVVVGDPDSGTIGTLTDWDEQFKASVRWGDISIGRWAYTDSLTLDITATMAALEEANDPATIWRRHELKEATTGDPHP